MKGYIDAVAFSPSGRLLAATVRNGRALAGGDAQETSMLHLWEVLTGQEIRRVDVPQGMVRTLAFAPDGRTLASGGSDSTILLWDLTGGMKYGKSKTAAPTAGDLPGLWADLAGDAAKADRALWALVRAPKQSVPFLQEQVRPAAPADGQKVAALVADLDSKNFAVRAQAGRALEELGASAEAALRKALMGSHPLEVRLRLEQILEKRGQETLRQLRAIAALEQIGTVEARQVLQALVQATPNPQVAQAAGAALWRLDRRIARNPG
jgi:hypothetical protein